MSTELDELDWNDASQFLSPSSEHGSDGEAYVPEASQQDEMVRIFRRRAKRQRLFGPGGALDSQTSSQAYVAHMHHDAGQSIHTRRTREAHRLSLDKIAIFREELAAFGIVFGLSTAPSATAEKAGSLKRPLTDISNSQTAGPSNGPKLLRLPTYIHLRMGGPYGYSKTVQQIVLNPKEWGDFLPKCGQDNWLLPTLTSGYAYSKSLSAKQPRGTLGALRNNHSIKPDTTSTEFERAVKQLSPFCHKRDGFRIWGVVPYLVSGVLGGVDVVA
ncbi:hypothetical protein DFH06DRAFT_1134169 [Mycena polygramma]|nr:hypothetical protein DFH06DRAFT_1134169 [Mycena polygramma]